MTNCRFVLFAALLLTPSLAAAQGQAGPFGGLFGRTPERVGKEFTGLEFRTTVGGQYDAAIADATALPGSLPTSGAAGGVSAGLAFEQRTDRLQLRLNGMSTHQQFFNDAGFAATSFDSGGMVVADVTTRLSLEGSAAYRRSPFFHMPTAAAGPVPLSGVLLPGNAFSARRIDNHTAEARLGFTSPYSRRSSVSASISGRTTRFYDEPESNFEVRGFQGLWRHKLSRDLGAHIGYGRDEVRPAAGTTRFVHEMIDVGLDLDRAISLARRTGLTFYTQTSMVREAGGDRRYRLNGGAAVTRGFNRTWAASLTANRNTEFLPGFLQPVFSDGVGGSLSGMLTSRLNWSASVGASRGEVGIDQPEQFTSYFSTTRLGVALTRHLGANVEYIYYRYDLPSGASTVVFLPQLSRQSVVVALSAYLPIYSRVRTP